MQTRRRHWAFVPFSECIEVVARAIGSDFELAELVVEVAYAAH
jgi:hypothetical protein